MPVTVFGLLGVGFVAFALLQRRERPTSDAIAAAVDTDATLRGELRSAHWFESSSSELAQDAEHRAWTEYHVQRATERAGEIDWRTLYPSVKATRQWVLTTVAAAAVVALAIRVPVRANESAVAKAIGDAEIAAALPPDLAAKLAAMMAELEKGVKDKNAEQMSMEELKKLMANLDPALQKKLADLLEKKLAGKEGQNAQKLDKDARPERAENATAGLPEDVKWALDDMASKLAQQSQDRQTNPNNPAASNETGQQGMGSQQAEQQTTLSQATSPMVREAANDAASKMMMGGGGPMGGDSGPGAGGQKKDQPGLGNALLIAQALKKEMVEANEDALGKNVEKEDRRKKTEQGKSSLGYTRVAPPAAFEPSRSAAPPPVPEARRQLLLNYFIRKK
jgi:hypothetical protein